MLVAKSTTAHDLHQQITELISEPCAGEKPGNTRCLYFGKPGTVTHRLQEMPVEARRNTLSKAIRTLGPAGTLLITEYGPLPTSHWLYRFPPFRWLLTTLEPFLNSFWHDNLPALLNEMAASHGKSVHQSWDKQISSDFYCVTEFKVSSIQQDKAE